jgi:hypothetical protein
MLKAYVTIRKKKKKDEKRKKKIWKGIDICGSIRNAGIRKCWMRFCRFVRY